jgi:hypothetical protein
VKDLGQNWNQPPFVDEWNKVSQLTRQTKQIAPGYFRGRP